MMPRLMAFLVCLLTIAATAAGNSAPGKIIIAHRGASGYLPEHTLEAYSYAFALGADYIEPDLVLTKDKVFICLHDIHLEATTNVEEVFPDRHREDGKWYAADFTLDEIKRLSAHERVEERFPKTGPRLEVPTFEEFLQLIRGLNASTGRAAGIYPELKQPAWHRAAGLPVEEAFLEILARYGYTGPDAKIFVQCFEADCLLRMRNELKSELPQIQVMGSGEDAAAMLSEEGLKRIAEYAQGVGPAKPAIEKDPAAVARAHAAGLLVHVYTFRADSVPTMYKDFGEELRTFLHTFGVDGVWTDYPDQALSCVAPPPDPESRKANPGLISNLLEHK
ncbi:MAG: glycerophosphodiester phosphodiesterase [Candidatus Hydrogenedentes bacterium]|nr:glycerophosphodiester phosphodiesterase [Candidatus Hydrogenedentota bacterium]